MDVLDALRDGQAAEDAGDLVGAAAAYGSLTGHADPRVVAESRLHLGRVAWKRTSLEEALQHCDEARGIAIRLGDQDLRAKVENAMGVLHVARAEYAQARAAYDVALDLTKDGVTRAKIALNLGVIANIQGALDVARRHYVQSLSLFRDADDERGAALALHNLGMLHADLGEWDEADDSFRGALALFEQQGNRQLIADVLQNRAEVTLGRGRVQEAIAQSDMALSIYAEIGDEVGRAEALRWKATGLRALGRFGAATHALNESIRIAQRTRTALLEAESTRELGLVFKADNRPREARGAFAKALELFTELSALRDAQELEQEIARLDAPPGSAR
jgi:tetratricopeptide (TPR) repeat protein